MYLVTIILPILVGLTLASDPHAVQNGALAVDEGKTTDDGTLEDDLAPGSRDGQHNIATNGTDRNDRLMIEKDALKEADRSKPIDTARKWSRKKEKRQGKKTKLENGEKSLSEETPAKSRKARFNNGNDKRVYGDNKKKTTKKPKTTSGKNTKTIPKISPMPRAMPEQDEEEQKCPCRRWMPHWDYSVKNISANGTFDAYVCSKSEIPGVTRVVAYLYRVGEETIGPVAVINCIAHFEGVKNGTYVISASAICDGYLVYGDGGEEICESGSKFSDQFVLLDPPVISDRIVVMETTDSIKPVLFGVVSGLAVIIILLALVCGVRKLRRRKRCRYLSQQSQNSVELPNCPDSSHQPTKIVECEECGNPIQQSEGLEVMNPSVDSSGLRNSWLTVYIPDGDSINPREISLQVSPSQGEICHQYLARSPLPDQESTSNMQTTLLSESVAYQQHSLGISEIPSNTTGKPPRDSASSQINPPLHGPDFIGIVHKPEDDVIRGPHVPLPDSLLSPKQCCNAKLSVKNPVSISGIDKLKHLVETKTFHCVENGRFHGENEPLSSTENDIVYDSEKDKLMSSEKEALYNSDEDTTHHTEKYKLVNSGKTTRYSSDKDAIHDTEKESLYVS